ncbi:MAG: DNA/RNA nuclease SfsA [Candidatus Caldarchaeales archaeon]
MRRDSRVTVLAKIDEEVVRLHLTNTGRLEDLMYPGAEILYIRFRGRKVSGRVVGVWLGESAALIDTILQAKMFEIALDRGLIPWLERYRVKKRDFMIYGSRFDYLLYDGRDEMILELKSAVYLSEDGAAMYPDTVSVRGLKHIKTLNTLRSSGKNTALVFIAAHPLATYFKPNFKVDPRLIEVLNQSLHLNVLIKSIKMYLRGDGSVVLDDVDLPVKIAVE